MRPLVTSNLLLPTALFVVAVGMQLIGCSGCEGGADDLPPWKFESEIAPYEVIFPPEWISEPPQDVNPHADVAAIHEDNYYFLVIPQELPTFPSPDLDDFRDVALAMLDESVDDFSITRQGPLRLDGVTGITVFASGNHQGSALEYITSYVIDGEYGYQIIAYAEEEDFPELFEEVDVILSNWQFVRRDNGDEEPTPDSSDEPIVTEEPGPLPRAPSQ